VTVADRCEELSGELENLSDRLRDLAMDLLREGLSSGTGEAATHATKLEKMVNRARTSVMKAASLLDRVGQDSEDEETGTGASTRAGTGAGGEDFYS
jgi:hypothetical protein